MNGKNNIEPIWLGYPIVYISSAAESKKKQTNTGFNLHNQVSLSESVVMIIFIGPLVIHRVSSVYVIISVSVYSCYPVTSLPRTRKRIVVLAVVWLRLFPLDKVSRLWTREDPTIYATRVGCLNVAVIFTIRVRVTTVNHIRRRQSIQCLQVQSRTALSTRASWCSLKLRWKVNVIWRVVPGVNGKYGLSFGYHYYHRWILKKKPPLWGPICTWPRLFSLAKTWWVIHR